MNNKIFESAIKTILKQHAEIESKIKRIELGISIISFLICIDILISVLNKFFV